MSMRHYFQIREKDNPQKIIFERQILGNNDWFDDKFYSNLKIKIDDSEDGFIPTRVLLLDFFSEWRNFLNRHSEMKGLPRFQYAPTKDLKEGGCDEYLERLYLFYAASESYEQQIFNTAKEISNIVGEVWLNVENKLAKNYLFTLTCY